MAVAKISDLTPDTNPAATGLIEIETASGNSRKCTLAEAVKNTNASTSQRGTVKMAEAVADLTQIISNPPTQAQVQAIQTKINALLASLRAAGVLDT